MSIQSLLNEVGEKLNYLLENDLLLYIDKGNFKVGSKELGKKIEREISLYVRGEKTSEEAVDSILFHLQQNVDDSLKSDDNRGFYLVPDCKSYKAELLKLFQKV